MAEYRVWNNTDLRDRPLVTTNRREAARLWRSVRPRRDAGNLYAASFSVRCETCEAWKALDDPCGRCGAA